MPVESRFSYLAFWRGLGIVFILISVVVSLMPYQLGSSLTHIDKLYHTLTYVGLMCWFVQVYAKRYHLRLGLGFVALGAMIEGLQYLTGYRSAEWLDALANAIGVAVGWGLFLTPLGGLLGAVEDCLRRYRESSDK